MVILEAKLLFLKLLSLAGFAVVTRVFDILSCACIQDGEVEKWAGLNYGDQDFCGGMAGVEGCRRRSRIRQVKKTKANVGGVVVLE